MIFFLDRLTITLQKVFAVVPSDAAEGEKNPKGVETESESADL